MQQRPIVIRRPSPSMVVALVALTVALGGTSYAAVKLPRNSVGNPQIKRSAVTGDKVRDGSLFANDFAAGQIPKGPKGDTGSQGIAGPQGPVGSPGAQGPPGPAQIIVRRNPNLVPVGLPANSAVNLVSLQLPTGKWWVSSDTNALYEGAPGSTFRCYLLVDGNAPEPAQQLGLGSGDTLTRAAVFSPEAALTLPAGATVVLQCNHEGPVTATQFGPFFGPSHLVAVRADSLDVGLG
jgi:hypothetical protein